VRGFAIYQSLPAEHPLTALSLDHAPLCFPVLRRNRSPNLEFHRNRAPDFRRPSNCDVGALIRRTRVVTANESGDGYK
jgi:hypothetical protein